APRLRPRRCARALATPRLAASLIHLNAHRLSEVAAQHVHVVAEADEQRAAEWLLVDHFQTVARADPAVGEEPQHLRVRIGHAREPAGRSGLERLKALGRLLLDRQLAR